MKTLRVSIICLCFFIFGLSVPAWLGFHQARKIDSQEQQLRALDAVLRSRPVDASDFPQPTPLEEPPTHMPEAKE